VEDLGPGRLEAAGLSPDALHLRNPRLAILRISPFGQTGPLAGERGDDRIAQAFSGVQFTTGFPDRPPIPVALPLLDCWTGVLGVNGLLMAIFHARRSGRGQVVDLGLYQVGLRVQEEVVVQHHRTGAVATRMGTESAFVVPANVYGTRDGGWIAVSGAGDQPFVRLCEAVEAPEAPKDPRFATPAARLEHRAASNALVASWIARHDLAEVEARFFACGVTGTAIRSVDEIMADEHVRARGDLLSLSSETGRDFIAPAPVPKLSRTPARNPVAAPRLGEHTDAVRAGLGAIAARPRVEAIAARSAGRRRRWSLARSAGSACSISRSGSRVRWPRPSSPSSAPTSSWWSCPCPRRRRGARPARRPFASPTAINGASRSTCARRRGARSSSSWCG
jgi:crotonobetainyl-CoA:carnitine CoA-transferase CaiB-like acyl-CoA transferase